MEPNPFPVQIRSCSTLTAARLAFLGLALAPIVGSLEAADMSMPAPQVEDAAAVPPAPVIEKPLAPYGADAITAQPSPQHVWISGHYRFQDGKYVWTPGTWELPPIDAAVWVAPKWETRANGYVLIDGYWRENPRPVAPSMAQAAPPPPPPMQPPPEIVVSGPPPPPPPREVIVEQPGPGYIWVEGYWAWRRGHQIWSPGHWELPPRSNLVWVAPRWERRGASYVYLDGFWRDAGLSVGIGVSVGGGGPSDGPGVVVIANAPPPPRREVMAERGRPPSGRHIWIEGYWAWHNGRQEWMAGHWELPPRGRTVWVKPRWEQRGNGYVFIEGSWR